MSLYWLEEAGAKFLAVNAEATLTAACQVCSRIHEVVVGRQMKTAMRRVQKSGRQYGERHIL